MDNASHRRLKRDIWITSDMFYSKAFNELSLSCMKVLMRCLAKRSWKKETVNGKKQWVYTNPEFIFPYAEANSLGIGDTQFWKNMRKLIEVGFIDLVYQGGWYQKHEKEKDYSRYRNSDRWRKYNTPEFEKVIKEKRLAPYFQIQHHLEQQKTKVTLLKRRCQLHKSEDDNPKTGKTRLHKSEVDKKPTKRVKRLTNGA